MDMDEVFPSLFGAALGTVLVAIVLSALGVAGFFLGAGVVTAFVAIFWAMWEFN